MTKEARIYNGETIIPSINCVGKLDSYIENNQTEQFLYHQNKLEMD